ncbi:MAG: hypothetical protein H0T94_10390 [Acidimicrobiia bacterium]|nr:hypothetical protein [Acidimicrobiia bacterium]
MRTTTAAVLEASDGVFNLLAVNGRRFTRSTNLRRISIELDMSGIPSANYRFYTLSGLADWQGVIPAELCLPAGNDGSKVEARLFARSAIAAGKVELARSVGISETEVEWLLMRAFRLQGAFSEAAKHALRLPPNRYPDHLVVLTEAVTRSAVDPAVVLTHLDTPTPDHQSVVLRHICGERARPDVLRAALKGLGYSEPSRSSDLNRVAIALLRDDAPEPFGASEQCILATVPDVLPYLLSRHSDWFAPDHESPSLVRVAVTPGEASESDLMQSGHVAELARRWFVAGDGQSLARMVDQDPAVLHYRALLALREGDTSHEGALRLNPISATLVRSLNAGRFDPELETDPTVWETASHLEGWERVKPTGVAGARFYLRKSLASLYEWKWSDAAGSARAALLATADEHLRDEALNLLGFALHQQGHVEAAVASVEKALEGHYSANLQINIGVLAQELAPNVAAEHLVRLAKEAPSLDLKLAAARQALTIWDPEQEAWEATTDEGELPPQLRDLFRSLAVAPTDTADHLWVMRMLAHWDQEWLANEKNTDRSPNVGHHEHKVLVGRSKGPREYVTALKSALISPECPDWVTRERDGFVGNLAQLVFRADGSIGPAVWAFEAVDQDLPMDARQGVLLASAAVLSICRDLIEKGQGPSDKVRSMAVRARSDLMVKLSEADRQNVRGLVDMATDSYAIAASEGSRAQVKEAIDALIRIESRLVGAHRRSINWSAVDQATKPIIEFLTVVIEDLESAAQIAADPEIRGEIRNLINGTTTVRDDARRLGR